MTGSKTEVSPDGRFEVTYFESERMNGQWGATPTIHERVSGTTVLSLVDERIDGSVSWGEPSGHFSLLLRRWPDPAAYLRVYVDVDGGTVQLGEEGNAQPLATAPALVTQYFAEQAAAKAPPPPEPSTRSALRAAVDWLAIAALMLTGLALVMGWVG
ncbi:MAG: hypothetical protein ACKO1N_08000 [Erythrobacter sp.]